MSEQNVIGIKEKGCVVRYPRNLAAEREGIVLVGNVELGGSCMVQARKTLSVSRMIKCKEAEDPVRLRSRELWEVIPGQAIPGQ